MPKNKLRQHPAGQGAFNGRYFKPGDLDTGDFAPKSGEITTTTGPVAGLDEDAAIAAVNTLTSQPALAVVALSDPRTLVANAARARNKALGFGV